MEPLPPSTGRRPGRAEGASPFDCPCLMSTTRLPTARQHTGQPASQPVSRDVHVLLILLGSTLVTCEPGDPGSAKRRRRWAQHRGQHLGSGRRSAPRDVSRSTSAAPPTPRAAPHSNWSHLSSIFALVFFADMTRVAALESACCASSGPGAGLSAWRLA